MLDASRCTAIAGATVEIWHCDALGVYSGAIAGNPGHELPARRISAQTRSGLASFATIYPGWYPGRAVHIHVKVHVAGAVVHTGQLFFPAAVTDAVYTRAPVPDRTARDPTPRTPPTRSTATAATAACSR